MYHKVLQLRQLTDNTFVLRMERGNLQFRAGQHIIAGAKGDLDQRDYSVYSGETDEYLEILVREIPDGKVSVRLKQCLPGQLIDVNGPFGSFVLEPFDLSSGKFIFIASGTGISPFHSFVRSYPGINYTLFHGVRYSHEAYEREQYDPDRYILCTSQEITGGRQGRVTTFLADYRLANEMLFYVCGNSSMIYDVFHLLKSRGIAAGKIFSEVYF